MPTAYDFLKDQGSLIGGSFALIAGGVAYWAGKIQANATKQASDKQIAVSAQRDQLQAHCLAVGIYPELLEVKVSHERASKIVNEEFTKETTTTTEQKVALIRDARIFAPPLISQIIPYLYLLGEAGATTIQLLSVINQYNGLVERFATRFANRFYTVDDHKYLGGHLGTIEILLKLAQKEIKPIHDRAFKPALKAKKARGLRSGLRGILDPSHYSAETDQINEQVGDAPPADAQG